MVCMIARITGILDRIDTGSVLIRLDMGLSYEVLVPAYTAGRLQGRLGQPLTLHTFHFIESQGQGTTSYPRLAGFLTAADRKFYELFTTCKGVGNKRALRAMALATPQIAGAIVDRDLAMLQSLPEIGRRMAETIVATLTGKVDAFLSPLDSEGLPDEAPAEAGPLATTPAQGKGTPRAQGTPAGEGAEVSGATGGSGGGRPGAMAREALEALLALGENRVQAMNWIEQALREKNRPTDASQLLQRVFQIKGSG